MLIGIQGKMGAGKTLIMSALASALAKQMKLPLYSNYNLQGAELVDSIDKIWSMDKAIFCFDELWITLDSRTYKDNIDLTRWINQTRKKQLLVFYTTQHIRQVELRVRNATDFLVMVDKKQLQVFGEMSHVLTFIDWQYQTIGRRFIVDKPSRFYHLYDTFEVVDQIKK